MRWTKITAIPIVACTAFLVYLFFFPMFVVNAQTPSWLERVRLFFLPDGSPVDALVRGRLAPSGNIFGEPYTWAIIVLLVLMYSLVSIDLRLHRQTQTYGSAKYAKRRAVRAYHTARRPRWRPSLAALRTPFVLALTTTQEAERRIRSQYHTVPSRFVVGTYRHRQIILTEKQQQDHILITAPTGSGKSSLLIIPNVLEETGNRSLFIADLKNELYRITAGAIARHHQVWWLNPARPEISHSYNPLAYVKDAIDAAMLAECWVANTGGGSDDSYWTNSAKLLISAIVLHLRATEPYAAFSRVCDIMMETSFEELKDHLIASPSREARRQAKAFLNYITLNERLVGSVMTEITNRFQLFNSEAVRKVTAVNELDFNAMIDHPTAFYLSIPRSEVTLYRPLLACLTMQMFRTWEQRAAQTQDGTLPRGIACYMDEFANIGYIPNYEHFVSTARYLRVALIMAIQNFAQLDSRYGEEAAETIRSNANTHFLLPGAGLRECKHYSEVLGETTVPTVTRSIKGAQSWLVNDDETWTHSETHRRLITPDELRTMPTRSVLMVPSSKDAMIVQATPYYEKKSIAPLANMPYHVTHVHAESQEEALSALHTPVSVDEGTPSLPQVIDAEQVRKQEQQQFFAED